MEREQLDQLYHLLRVSSNSENIEEIGVVKGLVSHLLGGLDYLALVRFSSYYGERFLLEPTFAAMEGAGFKPNRIVEFGAGLGWLGRGLSAKFGLLPTLFIDKRPWTLTDIIADLEDAEDREIVRCQLKKGDLIVMSDFIHCVDCPRVIMEEFSKWPMVILEFMAKDHNVEYSYLTQLERYGATALTREDMSTLVGGWDAKVIDIEPYMLWLLPGKEVKHASND